MEFQNYSENLSYNSTKFYWLKIVSYNTPISLVFSVVGSDIIYYSKSLTDYWHGITISREINLSDLPKIPFWSDIAQ